MYESSKKDKLYSEEGAGGGRVQVAKDYEIVMSKSNERENKKRAEEGIQSNPNQAGNEVKGEGEERQGDGVARWGIYRGGAK